MLVLGVVAGGSFAESDDQSRSLRQDAQQHAENEKPRNEGDKGGLDSVEERFIDLNLFADHRPDHDAQSSFLE